MNISTGRVLDRLCVEEPCFGAVFTTYGFDPAFFEEQILRSVLRLSSDPVEQPARYHAEALRALQETPVAAIVDAAERQPGRRLPYDLLEVGDVVFHSKSALLLFEKHARLMVGSGNLTTPGYSRNTELFITCDLQYENVADAAMLLAYEQFLVASRNLSSQPGSQVSLFRDELSRRTSRIESGATTSTLALLDSYRGPLVEQISKLIPADGNITKIGMLAPFYERDDDSALDVTSVFSAFKSKTTSSTSLDVAIAWDNAQIRRESEFTHLEDGLNQLWGWATEGQAGREVEYIVPLSLGSSKLVYRNSRGQRKHWDLSESLTAIEDGNLWMLPKPIAYAPSNALVAAAKVYGDVKIWLFPATRLSAGRVTHRPLHAKLLLVSFETAGTTRTLVVVGSANMSRRALLQRAQPGGGNVELCVAFAVEGEPSLSEMLPELIQVPSEIIAFTEREFPDPGRNWALAIRSVIHDAKEKTLVVVWSEIRHELSPWQLQYQSNVVAESEASPDLSLTIDDFVLQPASAELILRVDQREFSIPILVKDLVDLPTVAVPGGLGLADLLMLLGRRTSIEGTIKRRLAGNDENKELEQVFGEDFGPTDVFRAWWAVAEDLQDSSLSVSALRLLLNGTLGVGAVWQCIVSATESGTMATAEAWFYGAELTRELGRVQFDATPDQAAKRLVLEDFLKRLSEQLDKVAPQNTGHQWISLVRQFYAGTKQ